MGKVLLFVQHESGKILKGSLVALTAAKELAGAWGKDGICAVALGPGAGSAATEISNFGVESVRFADLPVLERYRAEPYARAVALAARELQCDVVVAVASSTGKDFIPRVAVLMDAAQASEVMAVNSDGSVKRPMYAGNIIADVELTSISRVVTVRGTAFAPAEKQGAPGVCAELSLGGDSELIEQSRFGEVVSLEQAKADRPELSDASVVISGGRALASAENFEKVLFPLADVLGAAVGASRAAVDSGYAPNDWQVGQTGKVVAPALYIAIGISGAIQHLAGMKDSKVVVAINKDPDAPIYEVADYGLVADLFTVVPELTEAIKKVRGA